VHRTPLLTDSFADWKSIARGSGGSSSSSVSASWLLAVLRGTDYSSVPGHYYPPYVSSLPPACLACISNWSRSASHCLLSVWRSCHWQAPGWRNITTAGCGLHMGHRHVDSQQWLQRLSDLWRSCVVKRWRCFFAMARSACIWYFVTEQQDTRQCTFSYCNCYTAALPHLPPHLIYH